MLTANVLQRVFRIKWGGRTGTCFTVDVDNRQYVVTAKHVVDGISSTASIDLFFNGQWNARPCRLVGMGAGDVDIAVLALDFQLSVIHLLPPTHDKIVMGQDVYFVGFPYGFEDLSMDVGDHAMSFPLPFIKKAILSSWVLGKQRIHRMFLDGHNNPGFSGGPVVFTENQKLEYNVAGVVSAYVGVPGEIYAQDSLVVVGNNPAPLYYVYNTGIVVADSITYAVDLITANPIGFHLL